MQHPEKEACRAASCKPGNCALAKIVERLDNEFYEQNRETEPLLYRNPSR
jgi:hypothetical protein